MASTQSYVSLGVLQHTGYVLVALTTAFAILRAGIHIWRKNNFETHDFLFYAAYMLYVAVCGLYLYMAPRLFAFNDVMAGKSEPWPTIRRDVIVMFNGIFINVFIFWTCLWCAKLSLLLLYRKLMTGLPFVYMRVWWAVLAFCVLSWVGCIISGIVSCTDLHGFFTTGDCGAQHEVRAQVASLYYAYAVDVVSDFMILFLPMKLTWNLNMPPPQRLGIRVLFGTGFICIAFATLRVVQVGSKTDGGSVQPAPAWLMLWTMLESSIAVIIACSPAFAALYRRAKGTKNSDQRRSYDARGYVRQNCDGLDELRSSVKLETMVVVGGSSNTNEMWHDCRSSQEELTRGSKDIKVTTTFRRADSRADL